jgi:apolipoprotein N-acyltransferase
VPEVGENRTVNGRDSATTPRSLGRRISTVLARTLVASIPALLLGVYARWPAAAFLPYVTLAPWVVLYTDDRQPRVPLPYYFAAAYAGWILLYPQAFRFGPVAPFAMGIVNFLPMLAFAPLLRRVHHALHLPRSLTVPLIWVSVEWLRATYSVAHFDLYRIGASQARFPLLIQIVEWTGVYGLTFLVAAVNGWLADLFFALRDHRGSIFAALRTPRVARGGAALGLAFALTLGYGAVRLGAGNESDGPRIAIVQPNVHRTMRNPVGVHLSQLRLTDESVEPGEADLIVWPENSILDNIRRENAYLDDLTWLAREKHARLLIGALDDSSDVRGKTTNQAVLIDTDGEILAQYDKQLLFPWGEYIPGDELLRRFFPPVYRAHRMLCRKGWGFVPTGVPGTETTVLTLPWRDADLPFAALICNENTYPPIPAEAGRRGARFLVNITSEGIVGGPVQEQLLRMSILRAVESRIPYVRVGNTGISAIIDAHGSVRRVLRGERGHTISDAGVMIDTVPLSDLGPTPYANSRDAFAKACVGIAIALYLAGLSRVRLRRAAAVALAIGGILGLPGCLYSAPEIGDDPHRARPALERGRELRAEGPAAYPAAIQQFALACGDPETCLEAMPLAADCFDALRRMETGAEFFAEIARTRPEAAPLARGYTGFFLSKAGYVDRALAEFEAALAEQPIGDVYRWLGKLRIKIGDRAAGIEALRRGLELEPDDAEMMFVLGNALRLEGHPDEAEALLLRVLDVRLDHGSAWVKLGLIRQSRGDVDRARSAFLRAIDVDPDNVEARFMLAREALYERRLDEFDRLLAEIQSIEATLGRGPRDD